MSLPNIGYERFAVNEKRDYNCYGECLAVTLGF
jgi:hypothetical protein